jgi:hypothetical protein
MRSGRRGKSASVQRMRGLKRGAQRTRRSVAKDRRTGKGRKVDSRRNVEGQPLGRPPGTRGQADNRVAREAEPWIEPSAVCRVRRQKDRYVVEFWFGGKRFGTCVTPAKT